MGYRNFVEVMRDRFEEHPDRPCLRFYRDGAWRDWTYGEVERRVKTLAGALAAAGIEPGDRVALFSRNRPEWALLDLGTFFAGGVVTPLYADLTAEEAAYILSHSQSRLAFVEDRPKLEKILQARRNLPDLERVVLVEGEAREAPFVVSLSSFEETWDPQAAEERIARVLECPPETPLTLVYTSGTTGRPKGAIMTHGNAVGVTEAVRKAVTEPYLHFLNLSFLPLAHSLERVGGHFTPLSIGGTIAYSRGPDRLAEDFQEVAPEYAIAVPRFFEKVYDRMQSQLRDVPPFQRRLVEWALGVGTRKSLALERGVVPSPLLRLQAALADRLVFAKIRRRLGGRIKYFVSGGAPLSAELARFFHAAGILVCEGYGATETSAPATLNTPLAFRFGTVGRPLPGVEVKIAADGEVLVKGPNVFAGYFGDAEATREAFTEDGFYRTGDVGELDEDGFLKITDRKKELIITASGKNIAPTKLENLLKARPGISNALVHCDRRPYVVALLTLDRPALDKVSPGLGDRPLDDPELLAHMERQVRAVNERLPKYEQIKVYRLLEEDFSAEAGTLTLTFKLKRRVIEARYRDLLDQMYLGHVGREGGL
ncbi:MAG: AMP-dependent synthetase/ligase [Acidobacteriota bacterium]